MAQSQQMYQSTQSLLKRFHTSEITISQLKEELLAINPYTQTDSEHEYYASWIRENIDQYESGDLYVLSLTSSGSIAQSYVS